MLGFILCLATSCVFLSTVGLKDTTSTISIIPFRNVDSVQSPVTQHVSLHFWTRQTPAAFRPCGIKPALRFASKLFWCFYWLCQGECVFGSVCQQDYRGNSWPAWHQLELVARCQSELSTLAKYIQHKAAGLHLSLDYTANFDIIWNNERNVTLQAAEFCHWFFFCDLELELEYSWCMLTHPEIKRSLWFGRICQIWKPPEFWSTPLPVFNLPVWVEPQQQLVIIPSRNINQLSCPADQFGEEVIWKEAQADIMGASKSTCQWML